MVKHIICILYSALVINLVSAEGSKDVLVRHSLKVISDHGGKPITNYLPKGTTPAQASSPPVSTMKTIKVFPVRSNSLTVGKVGAKEAQELDYTFISKPFFLIGYDPVSIKWLEQNQAFLESRKAVGMVVNVNDRHEFEEIQKVVDSRILLYPTRGDELAEKLKIKHYPFYMDENGVMR